MTGTRRCLELLFLELADLPLGTADELSLRLEETVDGLGTLYRAAWWDLVANNGFARCAAAVAAAIDACDSAEEFSAVVLTSLQQRTRIRRIVTSAVDPHRPILEAMAPAADHFLAVWRTHHDSSADEAQPALVVDALRTFLGEAVRTVLRRELAWVFHGQDGEIRARRTMALILSLTADPSLFVMADGTLCSNREQVAEVGGITDRRLRQLLAEVAEISRTEAADDAGRFPDQP